MTAIIMLQKWITEVYFCKSFCYGWSRPNNLSMGLHVQDGTQASGLAWEICDFFVVLILIYIRHRK